jgi:hypothetical protein
MEVTVVSGQTVLDISIQCCGSAEAVVALAVLNGLNITDDLEPGQKLAYDTPVDRQVAGYYGSKGIIPATGLGEAAPASPGGIGYWIIELDNVVM